MRPTRFTIAGLMGFVVVVAIAFAGLKAATPFWASFCFTLTFVSIVASVLSAIQCRGRKRAFSLGFSVAGGMLFAVSYLFGGSEQSERPEFLSSVIIDIIGGIFRPELDNSRATYWMAPYPNVVPPISGRSPFEAEGDSASPPVLPASPSVPQPTLPQAGLVPADPSWNDYRPYLQRQAYQEAAIPFRQIAQSMATLLFAYVGGLFSLFLAARRERNEANSAALPKVSPSSP